MARINSKAEPRFTLGEIWSKTDIAKKDAALKAKRYRRMLVNGATNATLSW